MPAQLKSSPFGRKQSEFSSFLGTASALGQCGTKAPRMGATGKTPIPVGATLGSVRSRHNARNKRLPQPQEHPAPARHPVRPTTRPACISHAITALLWWYTRLTRLSTALGGGECCTHSPRRCAACSCNPSPAGCCGPSMAACPAAHARDSGCAAAAASRSVVARLRRSSCIMADRQ